MEGHAGLPRSVPRAPSLRLTSPLPRLRLPVRCTPVFLGSCSIVRRRTICLATTHRPTSW